MSGPASGTWTQLRVTTVAITQSKIGLTKNFKLQNYSNGYELSKNAIQRVIFLILGPK
jgi:hypothetical protein